MSESRAVLDDVLSGGGEMGALMRATDWARTALGPVERWPQSLRTTVSTCLDSRFPILVWWGPEMVMLYNDAYRPILGTKHPRSLGAGGRAVWPEIWDIIGPMLTGVLARGEATWSENTMLPLHRHGFTEECYFTFSYSPIRDESGGIGGIFTAVTETTRQVLGERRLRALHDVRVHGAHAESEERVLDFALGALRPHRLDVPFAQAWWFDAARGEVRLAVDQGGPNAGAEGLALPLEACRWPFAAALRRGGPVVVPELPLHAAGPANEDAPHTAVVLPVGEGTASAFLVLGTSPRLALDEQYREFFNLLAAQVTSALGTVRAYEAERQRADALAAIDQAKTTFFSNVSHEFRTPLTLMLGPMETALEAGRAVGGDELRGVHRNAVRLLKLVNALLDFSRIEAGRARAHPVPTAIHTLTADLASAFRSAIERAGLAFEVDCAPLSVPVLIDREMWEKIVLNLLSNALKFTFEGRIAVRQRLAGDEVVLEVEDTGAGIPREHLPHIFERFHRVESARARSVEGSGIGLALVNELVRILGGTLAVKSEVGTGTTFTVRIPALAATSDAAASTAKAAAPFVHEALRWLPGVEVAPALAGQAPEVMHRPDGAPRQRVLVADDNADMREYLARLFGQSWEVETASDGQEALEAARRAPPDAVVADVMMPRLDGFGLFRALRSDPLTAAVPVLLLSARAGEEARVEGLSAGVEDYVIKPFSARELMARVDAQLTRARLRRLEAEHRARLNELLRQAPVGIAVLRGPDHVFELANPMYARVTGREGLEGLSVRAAFADLAGQGIFERLDQVFETGKTQVGRSVRLMLSPPGGAPREGFFDFVYEPMRDRDGAVEGILVVVYDVTELARARRTAERASRAKDEFLAILGHELRNPLAPILTTLQLMQLRQGEQGSRERTIIERQVRHMMRLVDDLLDVSRVTSGKIELRRRPVELSEVVARAIEQTSPLIEQRRLELTVSVPHAGLGVEGDLTRLAQVVANLLTNAAKYTPAGGEVFVQGRREGGAVVLTVRDTGVGIDPEMLPRVFDLFAQEAQSLDRAEGGLGLGLSIVRSLVALHGGTVTAASPGRGRGSTFTVRLPLHEAPTAEPKGKAEGAQRGGAAGGAAARVLVVDDNFDAAELLAELLGSVGYTARIAHDGREALAAMEEFDPHFALLDIGLPEMDGYALARALRARPGGGRLRLVALTGYGQGSDVERSREAGFDAHLVKPAVLEDIEATLTRLGPRETA